MDVVVETYETDGVTIVVLHGEIDNRTAPEFEKKLLPLLNGRSQVLLDMQHVHNLSSAGLRLLLILYRKITGWGGKVALTGLSDTITDTMYNTGFLDFFDTFDSVEAGLRALDTV